MRGNSKGRYTFLMLAGVYLLYLGWQLLSGFRSGEATSPIFPIAAVLFFIVGVLIIVSNVRQIMKISDEEAKENAENNETESGDSEDSSEEAAADSTVPEDEKSITEASAPKKSNASLFDRAGLGGVSENDTEDDIEVETESEAGNATVD